MNEVVFALVGVALLTILANAANAQGTGITASPDQGVSSNQCWDISRNLIRSKDTDVVAPGGRSSAPETKVGPVMSNPSSGPIEPLGSSPNASARPAGMPDC